MLLHQKQRFSREKSESDCLYHFHSKFLNVGCNVAIIAEVRSSCWSYGPCIVWPQNCTKLLPILISSTGLTFDSWPAINRCMGQEEKTLLVAVNFFIQRRRMKTIFKQVWWWWMFQIWWNTDGGWRWSKVPSVILSPYCCHPILWCPINHSVQLSPGTQLIGLTMERIWGQNWRLMVTMTHSSPQWLGSVTPTMGIIRKISSWEGKTKANSCAGGIWLIPNVFKLWLSNGNWTNN